jgi:UDP-N-acetylmuramoylalanine--D-glutamate ligase
MSNAEFPAPDNLFPIGGHRRVTIMGLGLFGGGVGAAKFWAKLGSVVTVTDLRDEKTLQPSLDELRGLPIRFVLGRHDEADFTGADLIMVNPAVAPDNKFIALATGAGVPLLTEVGLVLRLHRGSVIAVTGANGKSTTTSLLGEMSRAANPQTLVGGNLGGSLLDALATHLPSAPIVLELSSFQLHYLAAQNFAPDVAVVTNL